ncbi:MAG: chemotaxis protein CheV [Gammaproteobacteria bacterium]|nr:chemotaxis protein CheV [Gammaproteobacteria bacterium]
MSGVLHDVDMRTQLAGQNRLELLLFKLGQRQKFGINVFKVQEVIQCPALTKLPSAHAAVRGIANMRGHTITVMDLAQAIGGPPIPDWQEKFIIITEYNGVTLGFLVNSVERIVNLNWEEIKPPPTGAAGNSYMTAVTRIEEELVQIIDVEKVMKEIIGIDETINDEIVATDIAEDDQHVLVADDSLVARKQIKKVLDHLGVECTLVNDGKQAYEQLKAWQDEGKDLKKWLALVISDVEMPKMDGYSLVAKIRETPGLESLHVILHTSLSGGFNQAMVEKVGANEFQPKFKPDELGAHVQERLEAHKQERG